MPIPFNRDKQTFTTYFLLDSTVKCLLKTVTYKTDNLLFLIIFIRRPIKTYGEEDLGLTFAFCELGPTRFADVPLLCRLSLVI